MGVFSKLSLIVSALVLLLALAVGLVTSGVLTQLGFWRWVATKDEKLVGMSPAFMRPEEYQYSFDQFQKLDLTGQTAIVTGANVGLGFATALHLARQGARVILACRNAGRCAEAAARIVNNSSSSSVETMSLDTSSIRSVKAFADDILGRLSSLDMLVLNAGIGFPVKRSESVDGIELVFATNHVGHFALYESLLPLMQGGGSTGASRVVLVSSTASYDTFPFGVASSQAELDSAIDGAKLYGQSKLAQILFAQEATRRLPAESKVYINACHPGAVDTNIWERLLEAIGKETSWLSRLLRPPIEKLRREFMFSAEDGALTQLFLAADSAEVVRRGLRGKYFHPIAQEVVPHRVHGPNATLHKAVWEFSEALVAQALAKS